MEYSLGYTMHWAESEASRYSTQEIQNNLLLTSGKYVHSKSYPYKGAGVCVRAAST